MADEKDKQEMSNYERLIFAIAILYASQLGINIQKQTSYKDLTPAQITFAKKIYEKHPEFELQVESGKRISEEQIVKDTANIAKENKSDLVRIVTVGDATTCPKCKKWDEKIVSLSGNDRNYPSLETATKDGFLHFNCRCALLNIETDEIPLKSKINPRYDDRKRARPDIYNSCPTNILVFN